MSTTKIRTRRLTALLLLAATAAAAELPDRATDIHLGVATCATSQCHGSAIPRDGGNVMQNEYVTWTQDDPHAGAYRTLLTDASAGIASRLGLRAAATADVCLDCHADNVDASLQGEKFDIADGVGCEACHGGAENWLSTHDNAGSVDRAANVADGMYAGARADARASLCLSCHLGTADKFATHRIMAAGHPRLAFELDTFTELWRTAGRQPHYVIDDDYRARKPAPGHAELWATGLVEAASQRMSLLTSSMFESASLFPELALYDCHACHRSMRVVAWRPLPRFGQAGPGMPNINDAPLVMTLALVRVLAPGIADRYEAALADLHVASASSIDAIRAAAVELQDLLGLLRGRISGDALDGRERQLLRELLAIGAGGNYIDYVSAEQAFMAVQMLAFEIGDPALVDRLGPLGDALVDDEQYRPAQFATLLEALGDD